MRASHDLRVDLTDRLSCRDFGTPIAEWDRRVSHMRVKYPGRREYLVICA